MASYRNTLFLLTCIACLGLTPRPSRCEIDPAWVGISANAAIAQITTPEPVEPTSIVREVAQAEEKKESQPKPKKKSGFRFSKSLLVLGLGAVIVTAGAVFILIKLMSPPDEEDEEEPTSEAPEAISEATSEAIPNPFTPPIPSQPVPVVTPNPPTRIQTDDPPPNVVERSTPGNNGYREVMLSPTEPVDATRPIPPESQPIADTPRFPNYDSQTQLLYELQHRDPHIRSKAIWELGQQGDSRAIQPLANLLIDSDSKQRSLILAALSEISSRAFKPLNRALTFSLQDENAEVRKNAIRDLSRIYDLLNQMSQIVQRATDDPDPEVQETARWALDKLSRIRPGSRE